MNPIIQDSEKKKLLQSNDIDWDVGMTLVKKAEESFPIERVTEEKVIFLNLTEQATGLFNPSVNFQTPLISSIPASILKPFNVVIAKGC